MPHVYVSGGVILLTLATAAPAQAQAELVVDVDLFSSYVWRGVTMTSKPVLQPGVWLAFPAGNASITVGGWSNIDLGSYEDPNADLAQGGGTSFNLSEFDPYAEVSFPLGTATLTGGVTGYIYPNDEAAPNGVGLMTSDDNTVELYGKLGLDSPFSPELSIYYDVDKVEGAYVEAAAGYSLPASEKVSIELGALAGFSAGQGVPEEGFSDESSRFSSDGFTHLDLSAGVPFTAGAVFITPVIHFQINGDDFTKLTSPTDDSEVKFWGGVSLSWSNTPDDGPETIDDARP
jgi:uncharacterized protein (TIGR02001 family)